MEGMKDYNELTLKESVEYLREKHQFNSSGEAKCIYDLIRFYDKVVNLGLFTVISRLFPNVRSTKETTSQRNRQCLLCSTKIKKKEKYITHQVRYDKTIISLYLHKDCANGL